MENVTNPSSNDSTDEEVNNAPLAFLPLGVVFLVLGVSVNPGFYAPGLIFLLTSFALASRSMRNKNQESEGEQDKEEGAPDESPEK